MYVKVTVVEWVVLEVGLGVKLCEDGWVVGCGCVGWVVVCAKLAPVGAWAPPENQEACFGPIPLGPGPAFHQRWPGSEGGHGGGGSAGSMEYRLSARPLPKG